MALHAATIFLGSFLLFQVQPLIGRIILPWFGGGPAVWTTCMLFFQTLLLAGYAYAHGATALSRKRQLLIHGILLAVALCFLPIAPNPATWKPEPAAPPISSILLLLTATVGLPYLALSASAPLVQHWFLHDLEGRSPYRLYALSNVGSLLALLSYPFLVEPSFTLRTQAVAWSWGFALYALLCTLCAGIPLYARVPHQVAVAETPRRTEPSPPIRAVDLLLWVLLSACGSSLLLATTNQLCQEVAVVPFLWIVPLALYLLTFILCFRSDRAYDRTLWGILFAAAAAFACRTLHLGMNASLPQQLLVYTAALFAGCMVCHGELVRLRPDPSRLTAFYLASSAGGALGGLLVGLAAPVLFRGFWEYPISWCLAAAVVCAAWYRSGAFRATPPLIPLAFGGLIALGFFTVSHLSAELPGTRTAVRNFYGVLRVTSHKAATGDYLALMHGRVMHGRQYTAPEKRRTPTSYYAEETGVGLALRHHPSRSGPLRVGVVGLGAGTLAAYGRAGDLYRFYEINPAVIDLARSSFSFLADSPANVETVVGDARIVLEQEATRGAAADYDLLVVDAFSSDAIPVHLLTGECFDLYRRRLRPGGLLAIHVTNRFLDLVPVVRAQGEAAGFRVGHLSSDADENKTLSRTDWLILDPTGRFLDSGPIRGRLKQLPPPAARPWTDDYASLWPLLRR